MIASRQMFPSFVSNNQVNVCPCYVVALGDDALDRSLSVQTANLDYVIAGQFCFMPFARIAPLGYWCGLAASAFAKLDKRELGLGKLWGMLHVSLAPLSYRPKAGTLARRLPTFIGMLPVHYSTRARIGLR